MIMFTVIRMMVMVCATCVPVRGAGHILRIDGIGSGLAFLWDKTWKAGETDKPDQRIRDTAEWKVEGTVNKHSARRGKNRPDAGRYAGTP